MIAPPDTQDRDRLALATGVALVSASLLMTELALTRIFSVTMYYHFAFLAISIALFGLSASGVWVYLRQQHLSDRGTRQLVSRQSLVYAATTIVALAFLVRLRVGLNYSPANVFLMISIYLLAAAPFLTGGIVISTAIARLTQTVGVIYGADLVGAALGCLLLIPLLNWLGAPGVVAAAATFAAGSAVLFAIPAQRTRAGSHRRRGHRGAARGAHRGLRAVRCHRHQGPPGRPHPLQQMEFILTRGRVRPRPR